MTTNPNNNKKKSKGSNKIRRRRRPAGAAYSKQVGALEPNLQSMMTAIVANRRGRKITEKGMAFLKCAFAPPDFAFTGDAGIPDGNPVRRVLYKHRLTTGITLPPGRDVYYILAPIPGFSYFTADVPAGTPILFNTVFTGVPYADFASLFGTVGQEANIVTKYRHVSNVIEFVPTANQMTWSGNVQVWKATLGLVLRRNPAILADPTAVEYAITGLNSCNASNADMYQMPYPAGLYACSTKNSADFIYEDIIENQNTIPSTLFGGSDFGSFVSFAGALGIPGLSNNFDSIIIKFSGVTANETGFLRTWSCVEYTPVSNSVLYNTAAVNPCHDQVALELYDELAKMLPIAVSYKDNENFWRRCLAVIRALSLAGSSLPGQYGLASSGVNLIANAVDELTK